jgi:hypothetical protein
MTRWKLCLVYFDPETGRVVEFDTHPETGPSHVEPLSHGMTECVDPGEAHAIATYVARKWKETGVYPCEVCVGSVQIPLEHV